MPFDDYAALASGIVCAGIGGELFVRGSVGLARWARVSPGIIGATVAAFATSSPEVAVSVSSAMSGNPQIALGGALGSNVVNVAVILAIALLISATRSPRDTVKRDFPIALLVPVITGVLVLDGDVSRIDGILLLVLFLAWIVTAIIEARKQRSAADAVLGEPRGWLAPILFLAGLALLATAGQLIVTGATGIAISLAVDEFVIGATIVAIGTSVPELAVTVMAKLRGHDEVAIGTILGSNIFNGLFVVAVAAIIAPIAVDVRTVFVSLAFGFLAVLLARPTRSGDIGRVWGVWLLVLYAMYVTAIMVLEST